MPLRANENVRVSRWTSAPITETFPKGFDGILQSLPPAEAGWTATTG